MRPVESAESSGRITGHLLVDCLIAQGTTHVFGVPGESYLAALDGFHDRADRIAFITCRQEGGAAFMAEAVGKLTGRPGVAFVTRGPGATNASIGVHVAFQDSTPMVLLVGDVASDQRDREAFQEVDYTHFFGPGTKSMAKRVERVDDPARLPEYVARAFATAMAGRPGPVVLVLPEDLLAATTDAQPLARVEPAHAWCDPGALRRLRDRLLASKRPFVIAGGGGWTPRSAQALERFVENWQLPVGNAFRFQDTFDNRHACYAGDVGIGLDPKLAARIRDSDLVIAIGPRLGEMTTGGYTLLVPPKAAQTLVHIHASAEELGRVYQADLALNASMATAARSLETLTAPQELPWRAWTEAAHADHLANRAPPAPTAEGFDAAAMIGVLEKHLPRDAVLANGAGNFAGWAHRFFPYTGLARGHKTQLAPTAGAMGYGVPAGIAAAIATGRTVVTIAGDGDFLMNGQELATATQHGAKTIVIVLDNAAYGTIRMHQERAYPGRVAGSALKSPDFAALARAYGYAGVRVERTQDFEPAVLAALTREEDTLIHVPMDVETITSRTTLSQVRAAAVRRSGAQPS